MKIKALKAAFPYTIPILAGGTICYMILAQFIFI